MFANVKLDCSLNTWPKWYPSEEPWEAGERWMIALSLWRYPPCTSDQKFPACDTHMAMLPKPVHMAVSCSEAAIINGYWFLSFSLDMSSSSDITARSAQLLMLFSCFQPSFSSCAPNRVVLALAFQEDSTQAMSIPAMNSTAALSSCWIHSASSISHSTLCLLLQQLN